jgi:hypothetical protein
VLTIKQKLELLKEIEREESAANLAKDDSIGVQRVQDIKTKESCSKCFELSLFLNYSRTPSPPLPRIIESVL